MTEALFPTDPSLSRSTRSLAGRYFSASDRWTTGRDHGSAEISRCRWIVGSLTNQGTRVASCWWKPTMWPCLAGNTALMSPLSKSFPIIRQKFPGHGGIWRPHQPLITAGDDDVERIQPALQKSRCHGNHGEAPACDLVSLALPMGVEIWLCGWEAAA